MQAVPRITINLAFDAARHRHSEIYSTTLKSGRPQETARACTLWFDPILKASGALFRDELQPEVATD